MDNYIRSGWCNSTTEEPEHLQKARKMLIKSNTDKDVIRSIKSMPKQKLCELLHQNTCHVESVDDAKCSDDIPAKQRIAIRCGGKLTCWDVLELETKMKDDKMFAASMSDFQKRKVKRRANAVRDKTMPCHAMSGNKKACEEVERCEYHSRTMVGALLSEKSRQYADKECHLKDLKDDQEIKCIELDINTLYSIVDDIFYDEITSDMSEQDINLTLLEKHMLALDAEHLLDAMKRLARNMDRSELCSIVNAHKEHTRHKHKDWMNKCSESLKTVLQLRNRYITVDMLKTLANQIKYEVPVALLEGLVILINFAMFVYENLFVSWSTWLILWPAGREYIKKALKDPLFALFFFLSFKFCGLVDPIIPTIEKFSVSLGNPHMNVIFEQVGKLLVLQAHGIINRETIEIALTKFAKELSKKLTKPDLSKQVKKKVTATSQRAQSRRVSATSQRATSQKVASPTRARH